MSHALPPIGSFVEIKEAAKYCQVPVSVLRDWTRSGHAPHHYLGEHGPLYLKEEIRSWVADNKYVRHPGVRFPREVAVLAPPLPGEPGAPPASIASIETLQRLNLTGTCSGVYFLCRGDAVVYVGQSISVLNRACSHVVEQAKDFEPGRVFFLPCPRSQLDATERRFIELLRPRYNGNPSAYFAAPPGPTDGLIVA